jgi:para-aminobenzoate synthetase component 1
MRQFIKIESADSDRLKWQLLMSIKHVGAGVVLDGNEFDTPLVKGESLNFMAGIDKLYDHVNDFNTLHDFHRDHEDWMLGFFTYDLKNQFEQLESKHADEIELPVLYFFIPRFLFIQKRGQWSLGYDDVHDTESSAKAFLERLEEEFELKEQFPDVRLVSKVTHVEYVDVVNKILWHIQRGDIYEVNYCIEFYAQQLKVSPFYLYNKLKELSPTPFSGFLKYHDKSLICASPERYLKKTGRILVSQPIKGTSPRSKNRREDRANIKYLLTSVKERSENIMITDLVRNDLSKVAEKGSVAVEELCGVYSFRQVHQMISTISAQMQDDKTWLDAIRATFPMGSMTGAPKIRAMELIELYETTKRGLYSGSIGYVTPEGDFDFNVVIRSMLYNQKKAYLSFMVGSAITSLADPDQEYQECLLKASAIMEVLRANE